MTVMTWLKNWRKKPRVCYCSRLLQNELGVESHFARLRLLDPQRFSSLDRFLDEEEQYHQTAKIAEVLMSDLPLEEGHLAAIECLLGRSIQDEPEQRFRCYSRLLDRHGTGRILFRNTREAFRVSRVVTVNRHLYQHLQTGQKTVSYVNRCGRKKLNLWMAHGWNMIHA